MLSKKPHFWAEKSVFPVLNAIFKFLVMSKQKVDSKIEVPRENLLSNM